MNPQISVVMPAYNAEKYISEAIESILSQSFSDFELIVIDDASEDDTLEIIRSFKDSRISLLCNEKNRGIAYSTNRGIEHSHGIYIALMDDDDISVNNRLNIEIAFLKDHRDTVIVGGNSEIIDEHGRHVRYCNVPFNNPKFIKAWLLFRCLTFYNGTAMIRSDFIKKYDLRYREGFYGMQDYMFYVEASKVANISAVGEIVLKKREYGCNTTNEQVRKFREKRAETYDKIRRFSLTESGFHICERDIHILNAALKEFNSCFVDEKQEREVLDVFREIMRQARDLSVDYYEELIFAIKKLMCDMRYKSDFLSDCFYLSERGRLTEAK